ncbi:MAG: putative transrane anti-sigma factor [Acidobacteria bacterium]|nr:putative transrane anti-sigma factor [Acidobacteriota bacterium]
MIDEHWTAAQAERFADGEQSGGDEHLRTCVRCANAVLAAMEMKRAVREAMSAAPAPASLHRRLSAPSRFASHGPWWMATAAAVALAVLATLLLGRPRPTVFTELNDLHVTIVGSAQPVEVISTDRHTVKPWFEGRVPFTVPIPELAGSPFRLIGGRVVYVEGRQAAYLLLGRNAHRISLFVFRAADRPRDLGTPPATVTTAAWEDRGLAFIAVADVPPAELAGLREAFQRAQ